ncbi:hypothetical protein J6590_081271 [Homalodisca vitripennis]|nr:hypothetical protein J6590_081271 [Homalodisca vitripennis]
MSTSDPQGFQGVDRYMSRRHRYPPLHDTVTDIRVVDIVQGTPSVYLTLKGKPSGRPNRLQLGHYETRSRAALPGIASSPYLPPDRETDVTPYQTVNRGRRYIGRQSLKSIRAFN